MNLRIYFAHLHPAAKNSLGLQPWATFCLHGNFQCFKRNHSMNTNILIRNHPEPSKTLTRKNLLWSLPNIQDLIHHGICWGYWQISENAVRDISKNKVSSFHLTVLSHLEGPRYRAWCEGAPVISEKGKRYQAEYGYIGYWVFHLTQPLVKFFPWEE